MLSADLAAALRAPGSPADIPLMPRDTITVFDLQTSREYVIQSLMDELRLQSNLAQPTQIVHIDGRVKVPGDYPLETGMRVSDLLRAGGSLDSAAYGTRAELSRYVVENGGQRRTRGDFGRSGSDSPWGPKLPICPLQALRPAVHQADFRLDRTGSGDAQG